MPFQMDTYLKRIRAPEVGATRKGLACLQFAHINAIAFENIDPLLGTIPRIDKEAVWDKLITHMRGGYCFEHNTLLGQALAELGFTYKTILARVRVGAATGGPRSHIAFVVDVDGEKWLTDAGFGGPAPLEPVSLDTSDVQLIKGESFRVIRDDIADEHVLQRLNGREWFSLYGFDNASVSDEDLEASNLVCATWEKSPFPYHLMMTIGREGGRNNLFNTDMKIIRDGGAEERSILSAEQLMSVLSQDFDLDIDPATCARIWDRISMRSAA